MKDAEAQLIGIKKVQSPRNQRQLERNEPFRYGGPMRGAIMEPGSWAE
jgi:hypothetical protein